MALNSEKCEHVEKEERARRAEAMLHCSLPVGEQLRKLDSSQYRKRVGISSDTKIFILTG